MAQISTMQNVSGQVALVYGGLGGIGQACCQSLLQAGAKVMCADIDNENGIIATWDSTYGNERVKFKKCDVTQTAEVNACFDQCLADLGALPSIVFNTAGIIDEFSWEKCTNTNLNGCIRITNACMERLGKHKCGQGGVLVLFSSILGLGPGPNVPVYTAAAHGIVGYVRSISHDLHYGDHGVRMNVVCPTAVDTSLLVKSLDGKMYKPELLGEMLESFGGKDAIFSTSAIADEVMKLVFNSKTHGQVIRISKAMGVQHMTFEEQPPI